MSKKTKKKTRYVPGKNFDVVENPKGGACKRCHNPQPEVAYYDFKRGEFCEECADFEKEDQLPNH